MLGSFPDENDGDGNTLSRFSKKVRNPFHMEILVSEACMVHGGIKISKSRASTASLAQKHAAEFGFLNVLEANDPSAPIVACTHLDATIDADGRRYSTFKAFLLEELAKSRQNLMICTGVFVTSHITFRLE